MLPTRQEPTGHSTESADKSYGGIPSHCNIITKNRVRLVQSIDVLNTPILDQLSQDGVISQTQLEALKQENSINMQRVSALLDHVQKRPDEDWQKFKKCLTMHGHGHLVEELESETMEINESISDCQQAIARHYKRFHKDVVLYPHGSRKRTVRLNAVYTTMTFSVNTDDGKTIESTDMASILSNTGECTRTSLQGYPGTGKSTLVNWCLTTWADHVLEAKSHAEDTGNGASSSHPRTCTAGFGYDIVLGIFLRYVKKDATFAQTVQDQIQGADMKKILNYIKQNPKRVLFIFDALDEYDLDTSQEITDILKGNLHSEVSRFVTSRHLQAQGKSADLIRSYDKHIELKGFVDKSIDEYIKRYMLNSRYLQTQSSKQHETTGEAAACDLIKIIKKSRCLPLCHTPLYLCYICQLAEAGADISHLNKTELYIMITKYILDVNKCKDDTPKIRDLTSLEEYHSDLIKCGTAGQIFFRNEKKSKCVFSKNIDSSEATDELVATGIRLGLIIPVQPEHLANAIYTFPHLTLQELVVAYAIVHDQTQRQLFISYLTDIFRLHDCRNIISFCCGMSEQCGNELLSHAVKLVRNSKDRPTAHQCPYFNPVAWHSGKVDWEAEVTSSSDISFFIAQCVAEFKEPTLCDIPLPDSITLDLSQPETDVMLKMFRHNKLQSAVRTIVIKNGGLSRDIWETATSVILPHELTQLSLTLTCIEDTAALAAGFKQMTNLKILYLEIQSLTETDSERILAAIPQTISLYTLRLRYFRLSPHGADLLSDFVGTQHRLSVLRVPHTDLTQLGQRVTSLITSQHLALLDINNTHVTRQQVTSLCAALPGQCPQLRGLTMSGNDISGVEDRVAEAVSNLNHLSLLNIRDCNITSQGLWRILQHLPDSLRLLDICNNGFTHFSRLSECRYFLKYVRFLLCRGTAVPAEVIQELVQVCDQNLPDLKLMYDDKSVQAGKQALEAFIAGLLGEINTRRR